MSQAPLSHTSPPVGSTSTEDVNFLDDLPFTSYQFWVVLMASAAVILDGLDNQMLGLAAPALIQQWGIDKSDLSSVFALGFLGMALGTVCGGWLGDRLGRKWALLMGTLIFGLATILTGASQSIFQIAALKFAAGVGLGGVPGSAAALISEFTPRRYRSVAVTFGVVCVSIGGIVGGVMAAFILPDFGWRALFYTAGGITIGVLVILYWLLPESPRFLAQRPNGRQQLTKVLTRIGHPDPENAKIRHPSEKVEFAPSITLLQKPLRRDTIALCTLFFLGFFMIYLMFNWAPTLLYSNDFDLSTASTGLTFFNLGGLVGAMSAASLMAWLGSRRVLIPLSLCAAVVCGLLAFLPIEGGTNGTTLLVGLFVLGVTASATQSATFAVAANAFPTPVRARGIGMISAMGRVGAILSAFYGAIMIENGSAVFFGVLAAMMLAISGCLAIVRGHVHPTNKTKNSLAAASNAGS